MHAEEKHRTYPVRHEDCSCQEKQEAGRVSQIAREEAMRIEHTVPYRYFKSKNGET